MGRPVCISHSTWMIQAHKTPTFNRLVLTDWICQAQLISKMLQRSNLRYPRYRLEVPKSSSASNHWMVQASTICICVKNSEKRRYIEQPKLRRTRCTPRLHIMTKWQSFSRFITPTHQHRRKDVMHMEQHSESFGQSFNHKEHQAYRRMISMFETWTARLLMKICLSLSILCWRGLGAGGDPRISTHYDGFD